MAVADTDVNIFDDTENSVNSGGGGGGTTDVTIYSSRNTIDAEEVAPGEWDINVAGEDSILIYVKNLDELLAAVRFTGNKYVNGDKTSCVISIMNDINMTSPTQAQADLYKVNNVSLVDLANKTYKFGMYLRYTRIISEGAMRVLQLMYPVYNGSTVDHMDTWTVQVERIQLYNTDLGGSCSAYETITNHPSSIPKNTAIQFSRYLIKSGGNCSYYFDGCRFPVCGANQSSPTSFNPFISEGSNSNTPYIYHTTITLTNCSLISGSDSTGSMYANLNAPIVIEGLYNGNYQKKLTLLSLRKDINTTSAETGVANIQIRSNQSQASNPWQITSDGTALVSHQYGESSIVLKTAVAVNDVLIQGQPDLQPEDATNTYNWVSLSKLISPYGLLQKRGINGLINFHDKKLMTIPTSDRYTEFENYAYLLASYEIYDLIFSTIPISQMIPGSTKVYRDEACTIEYATVYATGGDVVVVLEIEGEIKQYYSIGKTPTYIATTKAIIDALNSPNMAQFSLQTKSVNISQNGTTTISPDSGKLLSEVEVNVDVQGGVGVGKAVYYRNNSSQPWSAVTVTWSTDHYVATPSTTQGFTVAVTDDGNEPAADLSNVFSMFVWTLGATFGIDAYVKFTDGVHGVAAVIISL